MQGGQDSGSLSTRHSSDTSANTGASSDRRRSSQKSERRGSSRLPPRSRTGCWTCRKRKVKCDEKHPVCGPCDRLQQTCDYDARYDFRDDTAKQRGRRRDVSEEACPSWDGSAQRLRVSPQPTQIDDLPRFADLPDEEAREKKAELHRPGTYHMIANPRSFANLPEYRGSAGRTSAHSQPPTSQPYSTGDPTVLFIPHFEPTTGERDPTNSQQTPYDSTSQEIRRVSEADTVSSYGDSSELHLPSQRDSPQMVPQTAYPLPFSGFAPWAGFSQPQQQSLPAHYYQSTPPYANEVAQYSVPLPYVPIQYEYSRMAQASRSGLPVSATQMSGPPVNYMDLPYRRASGPADVRQHDPRMAGQAGFVAPPPGQPSIGPPPSRSAQPRRSQSLYADAPILDDQYQQQRTFYGRGVGQQGR